MTEFFRALVAIYRPLGTELEAMPVLEGAVEEMVQAAGLAAVGVHILDQVSGRLHPVLDRGELAADLAPIRERPEEPDLLKRAATSCEMILVTGPDLAALGLDALPRLAEPLVGLFPITSGVGCMGLVVTLSETAALDQEARLFLEAASAALGVALEHVGLFKEMVGVGHEWMATVDALDDLIAVSDSEGRITRLNRALATRLGVPADNPGGLTCRDIFGGKVCGCADGDCMVRGTVRGAGQRSRSVVSTELGGRFMVRASALPDGGVVMVAHDVSTIQQLEHAKAEAERLAETNRFRSEFLARVTHEFRTPLHGVITTAQMLADGLYDPLTAEQRAAVADLLASGDRLRSLVDDLIDLTRLEAGKMPLSPQPLRIAEVWPEMAARLTRLAASKKIELEMPGPEGDLEVVVDLNRFRQTITGLVTRSLERTPAGGRVVLTVQPGEPGFVRFRLNDSGPASGGEHLLGETLARRLVEVSGGTMGERAASGGGAELTFSLPREG